VSIVTDREEHQAAAERLTHATDEALSRDLEHWTVASYDSAQQFKDVTERLGALRDLHAEEETWIGLIATEIRNRRARAREARS